MAEYDDRVVEGLAELAGLLLEQEDLQATLARVSEPAVSTVPGCDAADEQDEFLASGVPVVPAGR